MQLFHFWCFAILMLVFGLAVILNRNPVASALNLVVSFLGLAALFMMLDAYFIGIIQILVYAGAVMVLFLFIIMLLDLRAEELRKVNWLATVGGALVALIFLIQVLTVIGRLTNANKPFPPLARSTIEPAGAARDGWETRQGERSGERESIDDVHNVGATLFNNFTFPFQLIGVLVLVATIGVVVLSRRELPNK